MALKILQSGNYPIGQYDGVDAVTSSVKGGEVVSFSFISTTGGDKFAADNDGYVSNTRKLRPAITTALVSGMRPLCLVDEGTANYGTLFGQLVGGSTGQVVTGGAQLGPSSAAGSGKLTIYDKPGLYAVTLDACDLTSTTGLQPTNTTITGGAPLYATAAGLLTPNISVAFEAIVVGRFIEFKTNGSLVTTPNSLVAALNSPSGNVASLIGNAFVQAEFFFNPEL